MTLDARRLGRALAAHGQVARVVVAGARGSAPREAGAEMLVWAGGQSGTIGGGALEWEAARAARAMLAGASGPAGRVRARAHADAVTDGAWRAAARAGAAPALGSADGPGPREPADAPLHGAPGAGSVVAAPPGPAGPANRAGTGDAADETTEPQPSNRGAAGPRLTRHPLGPALGQCCGGAVSLVTEVLDAVPGGLARALRVDGRAPRPALTGPTRIEEGWLVEPVRGAGEPLWIWGAGHVGRALVGTLAPLERFEIAWADVAADRFPDAAPGGVVAADLPALAAHAPAHALHLIVTHSHAIDLALCHALLTRGFASCGLIGSATKWARFRARLEALGHAPASVARIDCPIGDPSLGKHPQAIAVGVAASLLRATPASLAAPGAAA